MQRANKLLTRLKNGKRILIILDDLWEKLDSPLEVTVRDAKSC